MLHKANYPERDDKNWMKHTAYMFKKGELKLDTIPVRILYNK
jgi:succinate dehydrogenase/fumarate reductase flavoprotein subunit